MYETKTGRYDEIPEGMKRYINNYGCHFNKKLCKEAVSRMYSDESEKDSEEKKAYTKEHVDRLFDTYSIKPKRGKLYDCVFVANMCLNDYLGKSVPDEKHLAMFIRDMIDDPDAEEGFIFNRWYADQMFMNEPIDWEEYI